MDSIVQAILESIGSYQPRAPELLSKFGDFRALASAVLTEVLARSSDHLLELANASYVHGNGFEKLVCGESKPGGSKIRFHFWPPTERTTQIHDHGWSFYSHILFGSISCTEYEFSPEAGPHSVYRLPNLPNWKAGNGVECVARNARLRRLAERSLTIGQGYGLTPNKLHEVRVTDSSGAVTLVLQSCHTQKYSHVVLNSGEFVANAYPRTKLPVALFVERLNVIRKLVCAGD